ncbi:MAG TPA: CARDB domain-containing protein, partial [Marmoricola sp.]|nr:CARDB domain-containing protein [Marmoricola sp.]
VWHLYVATTYDGGKTWQTADATPNDPVQRGSICTGGTTCGSDRNLLDFIDATIDDNGRIEVAYADGCIKTCVTDTSETSGAGPADAQAAYATIARQSSGKTLFAEYDPLPNLTLTSLDVGRNKGRYTAKVRVTNTGDAATGAFDTQVSDNGKQVGSTSATSLAPGASTTLSWTWKSTGTTQTVTAVVDPQNSVAESDESDNKAQQVTSR